MEDFLEFWLEDIMRPEMTDPSYVAYRNAIVKHINPHLGNTKLIKLSRGNVQQLYNKEFKISESVAKLVKTIMNTSMVYALDKKMISVNPAEGSDLPKQKKKTEFRTRHIDEQKTLNQKQVEVLIEAAKKTPIYLQVMFAVLMGLRRSEIIGVKYSDIDYINRTLHVERQLGKVPMSKKEDYKPTAVAADIFESYGTIRFINMFPLVIKAMQTGGILVVDEFDASIHPMALMSIINVFHNDDVNIHHAQLIFNTHNPIFLNSNLFRRDEIKFVERGDDTHDSVLYALSDFGTTGDKGVRKHEDYMSKYFISQYGAIKDIDFTPIFEEILCDEKEG